MLLTACFGQLFTLYIIGGVHGIRVIVIGCGLNYTNSKTEHNANTLEKGMNPTILSPAMVR